MSHKFKRNPNMIYSILLNSGVLESLKSLASEAPRVNWNLKKDANSYRVSSGFRDLWFKGSFCSWRAAAVFRPKFGGTFDPRHLKCRGLFVRLWLCFQGVVICLRSRYLKMISLLCPTACNPYVIPQALFRVWAPEIMVLLWGR